MDIIALEPTVVNLASRYATFAAYRLDAFISPDGRVTLYKFSDGTPGDVIALEPEQVRKLIAAWQEMQAAREAQRVAS